MGNRYRQETQKGQMSWLFWHDLNSDIILRGWSKTAINQGIIGKATFGADLGANVMVRWF